MKIFFWDFQDDNDIVREWLMFTLNFFVLVFTVLALFRTWKYYRQCMFQLLPLSINLIATFVLLNLKLFEKGYQFDQIGHFIEIFTYFLFGYTFAIMYSLINNIQQKEKVQKIWNIILILMILLLIVMSSLVFVGLISKKCQKDTEQLPAIISLFFQLISFIPTGYYGYKIYKKMKPEALDEESKQGEGIEGTFSQFTSQIYIKERRKQIRIVLTTYLVSMVIRAVVSVILVFMWDDFFTCSSIENVYIITSDYAFGQIVLIFSEINQLLPHVVIPIAMYVIPRSRLSRRVDVKLEQTLLEDDDEYNYSRQDLVQKKVSTLLSSRMSQDGSSSSPRLKKRKSYSDVETDSI